MKTIYFNVKTEYGVETVDQLSRADFPSLKEYSKERKNMLEGYRNSGMNVYISSRSTKEWRESK